jgi:porin
VRYRDGLNVNNFVGASSTFNPSTYQSGKQWRLTPLFLTYTIPELFGVKDFLTLSDGWVNPYDNFAQQPESKFFRNNAIISSKGISANGVGWSSGYAAWGGYMKIKPAKWYYAQAGLFLAIPNANNTANTASIFRAHGRPIRTASILLQKRGLLLKSDRFATRQNGFSHF